MQVLSGCGHSVHEDAPDKVYMNESMLKFIYNLIPLTFIQVAEIMANFLTRHKFADAIGVQ